MLTAGSKTLQEKKTAVTFKQFEVVNPNSTYACPFRYNNHPDSSGRLLTALDGSGRLRTVFSMTLEKMANDCFCLHNQVEVECV